MKRRVIASAAGSQVDLDIKTPASAGPVFDETYLETVVLSDGTVATLRLVRPDDKALMREGWEALSDESRYRRFLTPKATLTEAELRYFTEVDQVDHLALGATRTRGERHQGLGVARFVRLPGQPGVADAAVTVIDEVQRRGLGRVLVSRLMSAAGERGIERFSCDMLATNRAMRRLIKSLAPESIEIGDGATVRLEIPLPGRTGGQIMSSE